MQMQITTPGLLAAILLAAASVEPSPAHADIPSDVESARMNARAGGPTNAHDAELLKRWGKTTTGPRRNATPARSRIHGTASKNWR